MTKKISYPGSFRDYDGKDLEEGEINEMVQNLLEEKEDTPWIACGNIVVVDALEGEIWVCKILKVKEAILDD